MPWVHTEKIRHDIMKTLHKELHKELHNADICVPEKPQDVFSRREIESYNDLGLILNRIHVRLLYEGGVEKSDM